jgi:rhodanese-related sulfurtransferase
MMRILFAIFIIAVLIALLGLWTGALKKHASPAQLATALEGLVFFAELTEVVGTTPIEIPELEKFEREGKKRIIWLDTRPQEERAVSWIPGAISDQGFSTDLVHPEIDLVIVYDTLGGVALARAQELNLTKRWRGVVRSLRGGTLAWAQANRWFDGPNGKTKKLRVASFFYNVAPVSYGVTW